MELAEMSAMCRTYKGAALSCLILMWGVRHSRRNFTRDDLARLTGWSRETVADGLYQLELNGLVVRLGRYQWQLTDQGFQLSFDQRGVEKIDSGRSVGVGLENWSDQSESIISTPGVDIIDSGSSSLKSHVHERISLKKELLLQQNGVDKIDSDPLRESMLEGLVEQLIRCGSAPLNAREAIQQALEAGSDPKEIELRIFWWRCYCVTYKDIKFPGNLIAARVAAGIDTPEDFRIKDIPHPHYELGQQLEDLQRAFELARLNGIHPEPRRAGQPH